MPLESEHGQGEIFLAKQNGGLPLLVAIVSLIRLHPLLAAGVQNGSPLPAAAQMEVEAPYLALEDPLRATELDVIARLKGAYYDLFFVKHILDIVLKNKDLLGQIAQTAETRYTVGQTVQQDVVLRAHTQITILLQ